jgi:ADP-ribose pyrophosphatase
MTEPAGIAILRDELLLEANILRVHRRIYRAGGRDHAWEMVSRRTAAGIVACLPVTAAGEVVFLRQFRIPFGRPVIEIVAGIVEIGETPDVAIARELSEEAGLVAEGFRKIADFATSAGLTDERIATYIAEGCRPDPDARHSGEAAEEIETFHLPLGQAWDWLRARAADEIVDPKTFATLAHVLRERP